MLFLKKVEQTTPSIKIIPPAIWTLTFSCLAMRAGLIYLKIAACNYIFFNFLIFLININSFSFY
jgi:hypothetical protein